MILPKTLFIAFFENFALTSQIQTCLQTPHSKYFYQKSSGFSSFKEFKKKRGNLICALGEPLQKMV